MSGYMTITGNVPSAEYGVITGNIGQDNYEVMETEIWNPDESYPYECLSKDDGGEYENIEKISLWDRVKAFCNRIIVNGNLFGHVEKPVIGGSEYGVVEKPPIADNPELERL